MAARSTSFGMPEDETKEPSLADVARPKSVIQGVPSLLNKMFSGFRSR